MNRMKLRLLLMGCIFILLGTAIYLARGNQVALVLPIIGVALLDGGIVYPDRVKQNAVTA